MGFVQNATSNGGTGFVQNATSGAECHQKTGGILYRWHSARARTLPSNCGRPPSTLHATHPPHHLRVYPPNNPSETSSY